MIRTRKRPGVKKQYYLYVKGKYDGWFMAEQLFELSECIVTMERLTKRLHQLTKHGPTKTICSILDCMTVEPENQSKKKKKRKKQGEKENKIYTIEPYLWPAGSLSHTVR